MPICVCVCVPELLGVVLLYLQPLLDKLCITLQEVDPPLSVFVQTIKLVLQMEREGRGCGCVYITVCLVQTLYLNNFTYKDGAKHH